MAFVSVTSVLSRSALFVLPMICLPVSVLDKSASCDMNASRSSFEIRVRVCVRVRVGVKVRVRVRV